ncbi:hypothetical protein JB92DRAFT_2814372 [Gautieria morchelliformis]|nr:hypothetical protein JB92DRAFT_2814372 [Gautieria morchelliformis]
MSSLKNVNTQYSTSFRSTKYILPGELIDQVIDHLHDDSPSLRACCITCRAWAPSARFHIFHDIVLSDAERADALAVHLETSPHISPLVRSLTINGHLDPAHKRLDYYLDAVIPAIAPKLTRLKTLRVKRVTLAKQDPKVLSELIHNFSTLQELHISSITFNGFRDFAALIVVHPFLECLDHEFIFWKSVTMESHWENVFQEYPDLHSQLWCIKLHPISLSMIDWLSSYYHVLPVHTLTQSSYPIHQAPQMARLLQLIGFSLEHLTFSIYQCISESPEKTKMDLLSSNTGLRTLTFGSLLLSLQYAQTYA